MKDNDKYCLYEEIILSGQVPDDELIRLLDKDIEFSNWFKARQKYRRDRKMPLKYSNDNN